MVIHLDVNVSDAGVVSWNKSSFEESDGFLDLAYANEIEAPSMPSKGINLLFDVFSIE